MSIAIIIPVLVAGFIICNTNPYHSFKLHRHEGQYLYLKSAHLGLLAFIVVLVISFFLDNFIPPKLVLCKLTIPLDVLSFVKGLVAQSFPESKPKEITNLAWIAILSVGTVIYAYVSSVLARKHAVIRFGGDEEKAKTLLMYRTVSDSPLDKLFFDSFLESRALLITMDSRKIYVGNVVSLGEPNESEGMDQEIVIVPIISGYRDKDTLKVTFTTEYDSVDSDFMLVLRQELIISATWFDLDVYEELNIQKTKSKKFTDIRKHLASSH